MTTDPGRRRGLLRRLGARAARFFNRRFADLHTHATNQTTIITGHLEAFSSSVDQRLGTIEHHIERARAQLADRFALDELRDRVYAETETLSEVSLGLERLAVHLDARLAEMESSLRAVDGSLARVDEIARLLQRDPPPPPRPRRLADLDAETAHYLNWARSYDGLAGEAGLWMNEGYYLEFVPGSLRVRAVNERVVELPFAQAVAATLPPGSPVLDVGAAESPLALHLASLGLHVVAVDPRGYPFEHPNLEVVACPVEQWRGPTEPLAAIFCISTLEHLGVGAYGQRADAPDLDREVLELFGKWIRSDGCVVLTVPFGRRAVTDFERTYDREQLEDLLQGWWIRHRRVHVRHDERTWVPEPDEAWSSAADERDRVVMLQLVPPT